MAQYRTKIPPGWVAVRGNTFPVKEDLKQLGALWDGEERVWMIHPSKASQAQKLVEDAPRPSRQAGQDDEPRPKFCRVCGVEGDYPRVKIYRSGECQDCYEERKMGY